VVLSGIFRGYCVYSGIFTQTRCLSVHYQVFCSLSLSFSVSVLCDCGTTCVCVCVGFVFACICNRIRDTNNDLSFSRV